jgi:hypothetical protein
MGAGLSTQRPSHSVIGKRVLSGTRKMRGGRRGVVVLLRSSRQPIVNPK